MRRLEWGAIITLTLAIIGFAFWLGALDNTVESLQSGTLIEEQKQKAVSEIEQATNDLLANPIGFIAPINTVLGTPGAPPGAVYIAPYLQTQSYEIPVEVPVGRKLLSAWYVPIDNISNFQRFNHIEVSVSDSSVIRLTIGGRQGVEALLRIIIYGIYGSS